MPLDFSMLNLIFYCVLLYVGSFILGILPLALPSSDVAMLALFATFGSGLLMGAAFLIIIPEALHGIFSDPSHHDAAHYVGHALAAGFVIMLLVEKLSHSFLVQQSVSQQHHPFAKLTSPASLSVIIHDITDGWALGLVFMGSSTRGILIWLAIILHKAPTAFAIGSILVAHGTPRKRIIRVQSAFALAAPLSAVLTRLAAHLVWSTQPSDETIGLGLLFSAGTFLYTIATHVVPEVLHGDDGHSHMPGQGHTERYTRACMLDERVDEGFEELDEASARACNPHQHAHAHGCAHGEEEEYTPTAAQHYPQWLHMLCLVAGVAAPTMIGHSH